MTAMTEQELREKLRDILYVDSELYEKALEKARAEGNFYQESVYERADEIERDLVIECLADLFTQYGDTRERLGEVNGAMHHAMAMAVFNDNEVLKNYGKKQFERLVKEKAELKEEI